MTQLTHTTLDPATVRADQGEARWWFDALAVIKVTGAETGGAMTIVEMTYPRDAEAPLHVHYREDEAFWILEGSATCPFPAALAAQRAHRRAACR